MVAPRNKKIDFLSIKRSLDRWMKRPIKEIGRRTQGFASECQGNSDRIITMKRATIESSRRTQGVRETYEEGLRLFMGKGELNQALTLLVRNLQEHNIDYMVVGAVALIAYGYKRFTEDIDLVMTREGLDTFHRELIGRGYVEQFPGALKSIRATAEGVPIDILSSGEFPGDGKPKPVSVPRPEDASIEIDGIKFVTMEKLIELKLASGMTAPHRLRDLADVQELIKVRRLNAEYAERLDPYVRDKYLELLDAVSRSGEVQE
jgi:hypothetical protein